MRNPRFYVSGKRPINRLSGYRIIYMFPQSFCCQQWLCITSQWVRWRLKSPASRLFAQLFVQAQITEIIIAGLCEGEPPVTGGFPSQRKMFPFYDFGHGLMFGKFDAFLFNTDNKVSHDVAATSGLIHWSRHSSTFFLMKVVKLGVKFHQNLRPIDKSHVCCESK